MSWDFEWIKKKLLVLWFGHGVGHCRHFKANIDLLKLSFKYFSRLPAA